MTVKELKIAMTSAEEKTISRLQTRRKRLQKRMVGGQEPNMSEMQESVSEPVKTPPAIPTAPVTSAPALPANVISTKPEATIQSQITTTPTLQAGGSSVTIQAKKRGSSDSALKSVGGSGVSKILPTKRHSTVKRKPVLKFGGAIPTGPAGPISPATTETVPRITSPVSTIPTGPAGPAGPVSAAPSTPTLSSGTPLPMIPTGPAGPVQSQQTNTQVFQQMHSGIPTGPVMSGGKHKTRRFKARKMSITVKNAEVTRKHKKSIRRKVRQMDSKEIRKILLAKGMISTKSNTPDKMLRAMMKEYLLLQSE